MAALLKNITAILCLAVLVSTVTAQCENLDGSLFVLDQPISVTTNSFNFDNLGFAAKIAWSYFDGATLVYNDAQTVTVTGNNSGSIYKGVFSTQYSTWDGAATWGDGNGIPGYYLLVNNPDTETYVEMAFANPVGIFAARVLYDTLTPASRIEAYDESGNKIGCIANVAEVGGTNNFKFLIIRTGVPIRRLMIKGVVAMDNIQFTDPTCQANSCDTDAWCYNDLSSGLTVDCACKSGYEGNGQSGNCSDKDECNASPNACAIHANCTNLPGTYKCDCLEGFEGDGFTNCTDINECDLGLCSPHATCVNYVPGFNCTCNAGYEGDGLTCTDKDECVTSPCSVNANCTNTDGSYTCACNTGYEGDGLTCTMIEPPVSSTPSTATPTTSTPGTKSPTSKISSTHRTVVFEAVLVSVMAVIAFASL